MQLNFDARTVAPDAGFEVIPAGWYNAMIDESEMKPTSDGQGMYLQLRYNILDGAHKGSKQFQRLNLRNNNDKAVEIAYGQLSAVCHATGVLQLQDSQQLHAIPVKIKVSIRKGGPKKDKTTGQETGEFYEDSNEIKQVKNINEPVAAGAAPAGFQAPQHQQAPQGWAAPAAQPGPQGWAQPPQAAQQPAPQQPWGQPPQAEQQPQQMPQQPPGWGPQAQPAAPAPTPAAPPPWGGAAQGQQAPQGAPQGQPWGQPPAQAPAAPQVAQQQPPWGGQPAPNGGTVAAPAQAPMQAPPWAQR